MDLITELPRLPKRNADGHKGTYGRVLIVAGSRGMSGAACLAGLGALRGGAGLVQVAVPAEIQPTVAGFNPCFLTADLPGDDLGRLTYAALDRVLELAEACDVVAVGPGLGQSDAVVRIVKALAAQVAKPLILDADALNALSASGPTRSRADSPPPDQPRIHTPHPGEFARLLGRPTAEVQAAREALAADYAARWGVVLVLKGNRTVVCDGKRLYRNATGNPGMATGGTGDVLTGLIAALAGQGLDAFAASQLGVYLHGYAGDRARDAQGEEALTALDVAQHLPDAWKAYRQGDTIRG